mgnify:CR=1 FL=1
MKENYTCIVLIVFLVRLIFLGFEKSDVQKLQLEGNNRESKSSSLSHSTSSLDKDDEDSAAMTEYAGEEVVNAENDNKEIMDCEDNSLMIPGGEKSTPEKVNGNINQDSDENVGF